MAKAMMENIRSGVCNLKFRSHAQKYFLKVQKNGMSEHVSPPRPKRKAAHPYPHKASKIGNTQLSSWTQNSTPHAGMSHISKDRGAILGEPDCSGSNKSSSRTLCAGLDNELGNTSMPIRVTPDFAQVYNFLGSVLDPNTSGRSQSLKNADPINVETAFVSADGHYLKWS
ncbi:hypothetical protein QQ045_013368 [Rhodiola kirilowii]